mmetsp:Transcript_25238/g.87159  ORF Transcript_25238/g.87159 Transcript_25238/m.87159 type:complete len:204 (-) Transcript_25238:33-644(-)
MRRQSPPSPRPGSRRGRCRRAGTAASRPCARAARRRARPAAAQRTCSCQSPGSDRRRGCAYTRARASPLAWSNGRLGTVGSACFRARRRNGRRLGVTGRALSPRARTWALRRCARRRALAGTAACSSRRWCPSRAARRRTCTNHVRCHSQTALTPGPSTAARSAAPRSPWRRGARGARAESRKGEERARLESTGFSAKIKSQR